MPHEAAPLRERRACCARDRDPCPAGRRPPIAVAGSGDPMRRRNLLTLGVMGGLAVLARPARAQLALQNGRVGFLTPIALEGPATTRGGLLLRALEARGYVLGRNLTLVARAAEGRVDRLPALARDHTGTGLLIQTGSTAGSSRKRLQAGRPAREAEYGGHLPLRAYPVSERGGGRQLSATIAPLRTAAKPTQSRYGAISHAAGRDARAKSREVTTIATSNATMSTSAQP